MGASGGAPEPSPCLLRRPAGKFGLGHVADVVQKYQMTDTNHVSPTSEHHTPTQSQRHNHNQTDDNLRTFKKKLVALEERVRKDHSTKADWPQYRLTWRHLVDRTNRVDGLRQSLIHFEAECPLLQGALRKTWEATRHSWIFRIESVADLHELESLLEEFTRMLYKSSSYKFAPSPSTSSSHPKPPATTSPSITTPTPASLLRPRRPVDCDELHPASDACDGVDVSGYAESGRRASRRIGSNPAGRRIVCTEGDDTDNFFMEIPSVGLNDGDILHDDYMGDAGPSLRRLRRLSNICEEKNDKTRKENSTMIHYSSDSSSGAADVSEISLVQFERISSIGEHSVESLIGYREICGSDSCAEWLVKWKGLSHMHCTWVDSDELRRAGYSRKLRDTEAKLNSMDTCTARRPHLPEKMYEWTFVEAILEHIPPHGKTRALRWDRRPLPGLDEKRLESNKTLEESGCESFSASSLCASPTLCTGGDGEESGEGDGDTMTHAISHDGSRYSVFPRGCSKVLVKWQGFDCGHASWEKWSQVRRMPGATSAWVKYAETMDNPPARFGDTAQRSVRELPANFSKESIAPASVSRRLRDYQLEGVMWLIASWHARRSTILADEMGLGKTAQVLLFLSWLAENCGIQGPFLVVAPLSTLSHWKREADRWTRLRCTLLKGNAACRRVQLRHALRHTNANCQVTGMLRVELLVTAYDQVTTELTALSDVKWAHMVVDEAHRLKNDASRLFKSLTTLSTAGKTLLTGTPIQNNIAELIALLKFIDPEEFELENEKRILEKYSKVETSDDVRAIQKLIAPYLLRRTKEDLVERLPPKTETLLKVELTVSQKRVYRAILDRCLSHIINPRSNLSNVFMQLRKVCNHPMLLEDGPGESQGGIDEAFNALDPLRGDSMDQETRRITVESGVNQLVQGSGKMVLLDKLLPKLRLQGRKVLIFSQFTSMLDILSDYLHLRANKLGDYLRIDGCTPHDKRQEAIDRFQADPAIFAFLLSTRAGGQGINLTAADTVIIFDSDWNPQGDVQGQARAHRIGQEKEVKVYRLVTAATYEERMLQRAWSKLSLEQAILSGNFCRVRSVGKSGGGGMSRSEIEEILRFGAYGVLRDDSELEARRFCDADIDEILRRGVDVKYDANGIIHIDGGNAHQGELEYESGEEGNSQQTLPMQRGIFSRAIFRPDGGEELDLDDPCFWTKLRRLQNLQSVQPPPLTPPRRRSVLVARLEAQKMLGLNNGDGDSPQALIGSLDPALRRRPKRKQQADQWIKYYHDVSSDDEFCLICGGGESLPGNELLLCDGDGCENGCHLNCVSPPLSSVPDGDWLCPVCRIGSIMSPSSARMLRSREVEGGEVKDDPRRGRQVKHKRDKASKPSAAIEAKDQRGVAGTGHENALGAASLV